MGDDHMRNRNQIVETGESLASWHSEELVSR